MEENAKRITLHLYSVEDHKSWLALVQLRDQRRPVHLSWTGNTHRFVVPACNNESPAQAHFTVPSGAQPQPAPLQLQHGHIPQALLPAQESNYTKDKTDFPRFRHSGLVSAV